MTSRDFCYWLQGFFELAPYDSTKGLTPPQIETVKAHLSLVFKHEIDPSMGPPEHQDELNKLHAAVDDLKKKVATRPPSGGNGPGGMVMRC